MIDAFLHRYGGNISFLKEWTWEEAVRYIPQMLEFANNDLLLLRWFINYEPVYPSFNGFKKALMDSMPGPAKSTEEIEKDVADLMKMEWREADGEWN